MEYVIGQVTGFSKEQTMKTCLACLILQLVLYSEAFAQVMPSTVTLQASGISGLDVAHNGTFTLQKVPGYSGFYRYVNAPVNPSVAWGLTIGAGNKISILSGSGQFHGIWQTTGDIWTVTTVPGMAGTTVQIKANP